MAGETDLDRMLAELDVVRRPGRFAFVTGEWPLLAERAAAMVGEDEGPTYVVSVDAARAAGAPVAVEFAWLTLTVHSSLEAVGLTAAFSRALADAGIPCNVIAGYHHDHLLVPAEQADSVVQTLRAMAAQQAP